MLACAALLASAGPGGAGAMPEPAASSAAKPTMFEALSLSLAIHRPESAPAKLSPRLRTDASADRSPALPPIEITGE
jgi:hypothetical protein